MIVISSIIPSVPIRFGQRGRGGVATAETPLPGSAPVQRKASPDLDKILLHSENKLNEYDFKDPKQQSNTEIAFKMFRVLHLLS